jgi:CBS domain-containing protein
MGYIRSIVFAKQAKGARIISVTPDTTVYHTLELMLKNNISAVLIMEEEKLLGIFTERDYARKVALQGRSSKETRISEIMTRNLITISPGDTIEDGMKIMTSNFIRHLPVMDDEKLISIVSIGDLVRYIIDEQQFVIGNLEKYITQSW